MQRTVARNLIAAACMGLLVFAAALYTFSRGSRRSRGPNSLQHELSPVQLFDLRSKCSKQAEVFEEKFRSNWGPSLRGNFRNRYDAHVNRCYVEVDGTSHSEIDQHKSSTRIRAVFDAQENRSIAYCGGSEDPKADDLSCTTDSDLKVNNQNAGKVMDQYMEEAVAWPPDGTATAPQIPPGFEIVDPKDIRPEEPKQPSISPERSPVYLQTGTWIMRPRRSVGRGVLKIQNGTNFDSVAKLLIAKDPPEALWIVYIRAGEEQAVSHLGPGDYFLRFALGRDWDTNREKFQQAAGFYQAGKEPLVFTETAATADQPGESKEILVTLHELPGGNLRRVEITEAEFDEGSSNK